MFNVEERLGNAKAEEFLKEAQNRRLANAALSNARHERRERLRRRLKSLVAMMGLGQL